MKRQTAFQHLRTICERLDKAAASPENILVPVFRAWLFGSVMTEKANPDDIDLIIEVDSRRYCQKYRSTAIPLRTVLKNYQLVLSQYSASMKKVRINDVEVGQGGPDWWFMTRDLPINTPYYLIWQQGINWQGILNGIQTSPLPYERAAEEERKQRNLPNRKF
jgi:predicted nucleotidyltransferase